MIAALRVWFVNLSNREQWLVGVAGALAGFALLVFGIILPSLSAIDQAEIAHDEAVQRRGRIEAAVQAALAGQPPVAAASDSGNIDLVVTQSAAENGFDLVKSANAARGQMTFRIDQARAPALLAWLTELETQGAVVRSMSLRSGASGRVTVDAQLQMVAR